jgi:hypothetical protein
MGAPKDRDLYVWTIRSIILISMVVKPVISTPLGSVCPVKDVEEVAGARKLHGTGSKKLATGSVRVPNMRETGPRLAEAGSLIGRRTSGRSMVLLLKVSTSSLVKIGRCALRVAQQEQPLAFMWALPCSRWLVQGLVLPGAGFSDVPD